MFTRSKYICLLSLILCCAGCVKSPFARPKNLKPLTKETAHDVSTKEQVTAYAKKLNSDDQKELFGKYSKELHKFRITPVQLTVENKSDQHWVLAQQNIDLKKLSIDQVNTKIFASRRFIPLWIFLGGVGLAAVLGPIAWAAYVPRVCCCPLDFIVGLACVGLVAGIPIVLGSSVAIVDGISCRMSKKEMRTYLKTCCNAEEIALAPDITASMLFFVEEEQMPKTLNLLLTEKNIKKQALSFELAL